MNFRLELAETPPSLNRFGSVGGGTYYLYTRLKKEWQKALGIALMAAGVPRGLVKVSASATMRFSFRRKRDEGNFRFLLEKALGDTLVQGGWLTDDTEGAFTFGAVTFDPELGTPLTVIELTVEECYSCGEGQPIGEVPACPNSRRGCGHHCNCSWVHDRCCWCGMEFGEESVVKPRKAATVVTNNPQLPSGDLKSPGRAGKTGIRWRRRVRG